MPEIYDRAKIPVEFFEALQGLLTMRKVGRLNEAQLLRLFPALATLSAIESRYGETITKQDILGGGFKETRRAQTTDEERVGDVDNQKGMAGAGEGRPTKTVKSSHSPVRRKGSTHCQNPDFLEHLQYWAPNDYLAQRKHELDEAQEQYWKLKQRRLAEEARDPVPATYQYATQKLQVGRPPGYERPSTLSVLGSGVD